MRKPSRKPDVLPSPAQLKRMILAVRHAGLNIKQIEVEPNRILITTDTIEPSIDDDLSAFDIWKMSTERGDSER